MHMTCAVRPFSFLLDLAVERRVLGVHRNTNRSLLVRMLDSIVYEAFVVSALVCSLDLDLWRRLICWCLGCADNCHVYMHKVPKVIQSTCACCGSFGQLLLT